MKICCTCKKEKPLSEFSINDKFKDKRNYKCKSCQREYTRMHYAANREKYKLQSLSNKERYREEIRRLKNVPCTDCGNIYHFSAMDFDHISGEKLADVAKLVSNGCLLKAIEETKKCEVVCAVCHRIRTWKRSRSDATGSRTHDSSIESRDS